MPTKKKATPAPKKEPAAALNHNHTETIDIPHEEVSPGPDKVEPGKELTVQDQIKNQIAKLGVADAGIAALKDRYGSLTIAGPSDKDGYEAVKKAWNEVRSTRTALEKKGLELRNDYTIITKAIKGEEDRLIKSLRPLEDQLQEAWKNIDQEREAEKERQKKEDEDRLKARVQQLTDHGMVLHDGFYQLGSTISMDVVTLRALPDEAFAKLLDRVKTKKEELDEEARQEKARKEQEEQQRRQQQQEIERQQNELKRQQEELQRQQETLRQEQERAIKVRRDLRSSLIMNAGFIPMTDGRFRYFTGTNEDIDIPASLLDLEAEEFDSQLAAWKQKVETAKAKKDELERQEAERKQAEAKEQEERRIAREKKHVFIAASLQNVAGLVHDATDQQFKFSNEADDIWVKPTEMEDWSDEQILHKAQELAERVSKAKKEATRLEKERQQERQDSLSDDQLIAEYVTALKTITAPEVKKLKTKAGRTKLGQIINTITNL